MGSSVEDEIKRIGDDIGGGLKKAASSGLLGIFPKALVGGSRKAPEVETPEAAPAPPNLASESIQEALKLGRRRRSSAAGRQSNIRTSALGVTDRADVETTTLLGE